MASGSEILFPLGLKYAGPRFYAARVECPNSSCQVASFLILSQALTTLPVGTGYAMDRIGAVGATILGILLFHEPRTLVASSPSG